MSPDLLALVQQMFSAAHSGDPDQLDRLYAPDFAYAEIEWDGRTQNVPRSELLAIVSRDDAHLCSPATVAEIEVLDCSVEDGVGVVAYRWAGPDQELVHTLAWDLAADPPRLLRVLVAQPRD